MSCVTVQVTKGGQLVRPKPPKVGSLGKQWQKNKNSVIKQSMSSIKEIMSTYWCLTKLTLTPGNFEKPGHIVSFGVPSILKICK